MLLSRVHRLSLFIVPIFLVLAELLLFRTSIHLKLQIANGPSPRRLGAAVLSHHVDEFSLVSAFFLFSLGCVNILLGLIFRAHARPRRALFNWKERAADAQDMLPAPVGAAVSLGQAAWTNYHGKKDAETGSVQSGEVKGALGPLPERFKGMGFGRAAEKAAKGFKPKDFVISRPLESLPRYATAQR